jgi:hypothetical protein
MLRAFENRVLRRIFGLKRIEVIGGWLKLHNEVLHDVQYCPPNTVRFIKLRTRHMGHVSCMKW